MTILEQLADYARERTEQGKRKRSLEELKKQALSLQKNTRRLVQNVSRCLRNRNGFLEAMNT